MLAQFAALASTQAAALINCGDAMKHRIGIALRTLVALGLATTAVAGSAHTFDESDIAGSWVLTAQGAILGTTMPLAMLGVIEFLPGGHCTLSGTINAGGLSWLSSATHCGFKLRSNGTGSLAIRLPAGPVVISTIPMSFVVVDDHEIRTMATDDVSLTGVLRKQDH